MGVTPIPHILGTPVQRASPLHKNIHSNEIEGTNTSLAAKGILAYRLQHGTASKIQNGRQGAPKWRTGSGKVSTPRFVSTPINIG